MDLCISSTTIRNAFRGTLGEPDLTCVHIGWFQYDHPTADTGTRACPQTAPESLGPKQASFSSEVPQPRKAYTPGSARSSFHKGCTLAGAVRPHGKALWHFPKHGWTYCGNCCVIRVTSRCKSQLGAEPESPGDFWNSRSFSLFPICLDAHRRPWAP